jgi:hypothetical protein
MRTDDTVGVLPLHVQLMFTVLPARSAANAIAKLRPATVSGPPLGMFNWFVLVLPHVTLDGI